MPVVALITELEDVEPVMGWAASFAEASNTSLSVVCWSYSPTGDTVSPPNSTAQNGMAELIEKVQKALDEVVVNAGNEPQAISRDEIEVRQELSADSVTAAVQEIERTKADLFVAATTDRSGRTGAKITENRLLAQSPCNTVILYQSPKPRKRFKRIMFVATNSAHDRTAAKLTAQMAKVRAANVTVSTIEEPGGKESIEVGRRETRDLLRDAGVDPDESYASWVFFADDAFREIVESADEHDLVFVAANNQSMVEKMVAGTKRATVAVVKRAPPLRSLSRSRQEWMPRLSPADYADLVQNLRRGSKFSVDFLVMLGLAAAIATLGLLQDSAAVVIGSMLLAPLMTPMVGAGLALAQANRRLARSSVQSIAYGFLLTLVISTVVGFLTPGQELTSQVMARVNPNLLDLAIALFSAAAAAYAMARPNLSGAVAGVAIATALVPPLCSSGIAFAYGQVLYGLGASLLFITNLVAIILAAALTFRMMGVTSRRREATEGRWVYRSFASLALVIVALSFPLERSLQEQIDLGRPQPLGFPLTKELVDKLLERVDQDPGVEIILAARPSRVDYRADAVIYLASEEPLPRSYGDELKQIVREFLANPEAVVEVVVVQQAWQDEPLGISP
ncbi:MAG: TIGR00341 family protein [Pirellulales bacterium]|nr:TIGR00341 family protein [Pirellulales bacterium]